MDTVPGPDSTLRLPYLVVLDSCGCRMRVSLPISWQTAQSQCQVRYVHTQVSVHTIATSVPVLILEYGALYGVS